MEKLKHSGAFFWNVRATSARGRFTSKLSDLKNVLPLLACSRCSAGVWGRLPHADSRIVRRTARMRARFMFSPQYNARWRLACRIETRRRKNGGGINRRASSNPEKANPQWNQHGAEHAVQA